MNRLQRILTSRLAGALLVAAAVHATLQFTAPRRTIVQELHPYLGWYMLPNQDQWDTFLKIPEHINSFGFRGGEWNLQKSEGTVRIAVQGSSMTYGSSVEFSNIYSTLLEKALREAGVQAEVYNFAVQGYTLEQSVRNYEKNIVNFKPDYLIQAFADQDVKPMEPPSTPPAGDLRPWLARTEYYRKFQTIWRPFVKSLAPENPTPSWAGESKRKKQEAINYKLVTDPYAAEMIPMWERAREAMERLYKLTNAGGTKLIITVLPQPPQAFDRRFAGPEFYWKRFAAEHTDGCYYLDCIEALRTEIEPVRERILSSPDAASRERLINNFGNADPRHVYHGDKGGHFNENGMRVIAQALAEGLQPLLKK